MKTSNLFLMALGFMVLSGMYMTNVFLKREYQKIDLTDPYKNYVSVPSDAYSVLDISGSNGYPIDLVYNPKNDIKVLRSRLGHFNSRVSNDTLYIQFTGSNIPMEQRHHSNTPPGIIIHHKSLSSIIIADTHNRVEGFAKQDMHITLKGNSLLEMRNCNLNVLDVELKNTSQIEFLNVNTIDSFNLTMANESIASLYKVDFQSINHSLGDSVIVVLSKGTFDGILNQ